MNGSKITKNDGRVLITDDIETFIKSEYNYKEKIVSIRFGNVYENSVDLFLYTGSSRGIYLDTVNINLDFFYKLSDMVKSMYKK